jgi:hypothetical protein
MMTSGRNLLTTILLAATILFIGSSACCAQDDTPPLRMLLNLDLFTPHGSSPPGAPADDNDSMLEQVRTLRAMGYLSPDGPLPAAEDHPDEPPHPPATFAPMNQGAQQ